MRVGFIGLGTLMPLDIPTDGTMLIERLHESLITTWLAQGDCLPNFRVDATLVNALFANRTTLLGTRGLNQPSTKIDRLALESKLTYHALWLRQKFDQFQVLSEDERHRLSSLVESWLRALLKCLSAGSVVECSECLQDACDAHLRQLVVLATQNGSANSQACSEEYAVALQLKVLQLQLDGICEPILDLGCGRDGCLVKWLRDNKKNAIGIDLCPNNTQGCLSADWFKFPFLPNQFGTILAHLSFSLQFLHQHLKADSDAARYARLYMSILHSLRQGGLLAYAPGLPFIEKLLPADKYKVQRFNVPDLPVDEIAAGIFARQLGENPLYTCQVVRL
jgi:hypothetical protein